MKRVILLFAFFSVFSLSSFSQDAMLGEIKLFAGNFAPVDWMFCEGQTLQIAQYQALYAVIGMQYGGNGQVTFALPDLRDAVPVSASATKPQGSVNAGSKFKVDNTQTTTTVKTVALRYIICINGIFPVRD